MAIKHIAHHVYVKPCFLTSHLMAHLSYTSCDIRQKSQSHEQIHVQGNCINAVNQYGHLEDLLFVIISKWKHSNYLFFVFLSNLNLVYVFFFIPFHVSRPL